MFSSLANLRSVDALGGVFDLSEAGEVDAVVAEHGGALGVGGAGALRRAGEHEPVLRLVVVPLDARVHARVGLVVGVDDLVGRGEHGGEVDEHVGGGEVLGGVDLTHQAQVLVVGGEACGGDLWTHEGGSVERHTRTLKR